MLDMTKYPPLATDFRENTFLVPELPNVGSNSLCAMYPQDTSAPRGMSFISMNKDTVDAKTLLYSSATSMFAVCASLMTATSLLLAF